MTEFNPDEHTVAEVNEYLASASPEEARRVLAAESAGKDRASVAAPEGVTDRATSEPSAPQTVAGKPEWNVTTHGPVPEDQRDLYEVTGE